MGGVVALYTKLALALFQSHSEEEVYILCEVLNCILLCSDDIKMHCVEEIGVDLITLLIKILKDCLSQRFADAKGVILENTLSIFVQLSFSPAAESILSKQAQFLELLMDIVVDESTPSDEAKADALALVANLAFSKDSHNSKPTAQFVNTLIDLTYNGSGILLDRSLAVLCHLSRGIQNDSSLSSLFANENLLKKLGDILTSNDALKTGYSAGILNNMSVSASASFELVSNGFLLDILLDVISEGESKSENETWVCSVNAFTNLIRPDTATTMASQVNLLDRLCTISSRGRTLQIREAGSLALKLISINMNMRLEQSSLATSTSGSHSSSYTYHAG